MTGEPEPRWLDADEMEAWLALVDLITLLPQRLDLQLRRDAGISHVYYQILAMLSAAPDRRMTMSDLAAKTGTSLSRLSHAVSSLESRGWVERCRCEQDGRVQFAGLTDSGVALLELIAPAHVEEVRGLVFDQLTRQDVARLRDIATRIAGRARGRD